ncbi:MAG TPA: hypothetical protein VIT88_07865 [Pyrinomonadaceae bacterium]
MKFSILTILTGTLLVTSLFVSLNQGEHSAAETDRIVSAFTAKETEFRKAWAQYSIKRDAKIQTIGPGGQVSGEYQRTSRIAFDDTGKPLEKILFFPTSTLVGLAISTQDLDDLGGVQFFPLEASKVPLYNFKYVGKERIDELDLHVFDISPKALPDAKRIKERFFQGRVWVDTEGNQIVKTRGKGVPEPKNAQFPTVEIFREEIDGFWFPTYAYADEELMLPGGYPLRIRMRVRFSEFEKATRK